MTATKIFFLLAIAGHLLCGWCDCLLTYLPGGRFRAGYLSDNEKLSKVFEGAPLKSSIVSMIAGCLALFVCFFGYLALCAWMRPFSAACANIMVFGAALFFLPGEAHHVFCGAVEWFYIRLNRTEEARKIIVEFFKKTSATMIICYIGLFIFSAALLVGVVSGKTTLPAWACVFNVLPLFIALSPLRVAGTGNWAGALMFLGLFLLI